VPANLAISEKTFANHVVQLARGLGWQEFRTWNSKHSPAGWPDLVLLRPPRMVIAELKTEKGKLTPIQKQVLEMLQQIPGHQVYLWRPRDWDNIVKILQTPAWRGLETGVPMPEIRSEERA